MIKELITTIVYDKLSDEQFVECYNIYCIIEKRFTDQVFEFTDDWLYRNFTDIVSLAKSIGGDWWYEAKYICWNSDNKLITFNSPSREWLIAKDELTTHIIDNFERYEGVIGKWLQEAR